MRPWLTSGRLSRGLTAQRLLTQGPAVQLLLKTTSAETAEHVGIQKLKQFHMVNIKMGGLKGERVRPQSIRPLIKFPRGINSDQVISCMFKADGQTTGRAPGPGLKHQASSSKHQASSVKHQASSFKAFEPTWLSLKRQASSPKQQASSFKPEVTSSLIREPWYMDIGEVLGGKGPRAFARIKVL